MSIQVLHSETPVARKAHQCSLCYRTIEPGEKYDRQHSVFDGRAYAFKSCAHCQALVDIIGWDRLSWDDEGYSADSISEFEPASVAEARLIVGWRHKWRHRSGDLWAVPETEQR